MKIGFKLTVVMVILSLLIIGTIGITLLIKAQVNITALAHDKAVTVAQDYAGEVETLFASYWYTAQAAARIMEQYEHMSVQNRRPVLSGVIKGIVETNPGITGIWCIWEPYIIDDDEDRFAIYLHRSGNDIQMETVSDLNYYHHVKQSETGAVFNPYYKNVAGNQMLLTSITASIYSNNRIVGVVGIDIPVQAIQEMSQGHKPLGNGLTGVFSNNGAIAGHFDPGRLGTLMQETERDMAGPYLNEMVNAVKTGRQLYYTNFIQGAGADFNIYISPITIGNTDTPWSYAIAVPLKTVMESVHSMQFITIVISVIILLLVIPAAYFLSRSLSKPIIHVAHTLKDIAEGEGDLTRSIAVTSKDEIGDLAHYFNQTLGKIKNLVISIKEETEALSGMGNDLAANMSETSSAVNEITSNVQSIKDRVLNQSASVSETHATMEQMVMNINKLNGLVDTQSSNITQVSSSIEQMVANVRSVTATLVKNSANVKALREAAEVGRDGLFRVAEDIQEIAQESEGLLEINSVMEDIASQTNLLSMNAAIEAAHAGESGKGFAVVAGEIRKLAESSGEQSKTIGQVLRKIKGSIDNITKSTENVLNKFMAIDSGVKIVAEQEDTIRIAMEEQGIGSMQILECVGIVNDITRQVNAGSREMFEGSQEVIRESGNLEKVTQEITLGINETASGAEHINAAVHHIHDLSARNHEGIERLIREVSRFKV
ncbi:MAG: methyl-accepting chemotaxis protein [Treponema sp.]|nr:methyl-accepting chemotaxis protein [Treponema sp.]